MVGIEKVLYRCGLERSDVCFGFGLDLHKNWRPVVPECLLEAFEDLCFVALDVDLEERDRGELVGGEELVAAYDLYADVVGGGVVGDLVAECSCALIGAGGWEEGSGFGAIAECHWKDGYVGDFGVVELAQHLVAHYGERLKGEDLIGLAG